jgi:hypothetical protein
VETDYVKTMMVLTIDMYATRYMEAFWVVLWPDLFDPDDGDDA